MFFQSISRVFLSKKLANHFMNLIPYFSNFSLVSSFLINSLLSLTFSKTDFKSLYPHDLAKSIKAFDGTHHVLVQSQPMAHFSTNATFFHAEASHIATVNPHDPDQITIRSNSFIFIIFKSYCKKKIALLYTATFI